MVYKAKIIINTFFIDDIDDARNIDDIKSAITKLLSRYIYLDPSDIEITIDED